MQTLLNEKQQSIISIAAFTATGDMNDLNAALHDGLNTRLTISEIKEILVQMYAYAGFPRSLNALAAFMKVTEERHQQGIRDEIGIPATPLPEKWNSLESGYHNQTRLVGHPVSGALFEFAPAIDQFLKAHLFGDIFQRDILSWQTRELATISALAAMPGVNSQLESHYAISLNNGFTVEQLKDFTDILSANCGATIAGNAREVLNQLLAKRNSECLQ
ncbi:Carboxymuconolactone decarboxylase [Dickeya parazeae Ech586]|uniref:Carboxymuconolactone decarboxylase n=2 Tax=Dickeya TaxID=204037 RepID=D2C017_DICZ5|nr:carboxymuconolactone decarboxylase family protein [Dickeya parazeae]ACZ76926.1 Carboxymuconolactone decarboxylase [Dickeya parazeae Ech586]